MRRETHIVIDESPGPSTILIVRSGWRNFWHVITEDPELGDGDHDHKFLHEDRVKLRYNVDPNTGKELTKDEEEEL